MGLAAFEMARRKEREKKEQEELQKQAVEVDEQPVTKPKRTRRKKVTTDGLSD